MYILNESRNLSIYLSKIVQEKNVSYLNFGVKIVF